MQIDYMLLLWNLKKCCLQKITFIRAYKKKSSVGKYVMLLINFIILLPVWARYTNKMEHFIFLFI